jgi:hypothetical protein
MKLDFKKELDVTKGRLRFEKLIEKKSKVDLIEHMPKRSIRQNSLYWMWLTCIQDETGNDKDYLHDYFARKFLGEQEIEVFGVKRTIPKHTPDNNTAEFKAYLDKIMHFAREEQSIYLPMPDMRGYEDFIFMYK